MAVYSRIVSVAHYLPERVVSNDDLSKLMETSDEWIVERTGISSRRFVREGESSVDLGFEAAKRALEKVPDREIDMIIGATLSPDYYFPGIGTMLQDRLGLGCIPALDVRAQCSGLVYGLSCADAYIRAGFARSILLVCSEVQSPVLDLSTRGRDMAVLFGDGAGALVIAAEEGNEIPSAHNTVSGVIDSVLGGDGSGADALCMKIPGSRTPGFVRADDIEAAAIHPQMDGRFVFKNAVQRMCETAASILQRNSIEPASIDLLLPHQANLRINEAVRTHLGLEENQVFNTISNLGNTTAATIPIGMSLALEEDRIRRGSLILTLAFGAGFTWGANLLRW